MNPIVSTALAGCRAVLLDWDGTLADTRERNYRSLRDALAPYRVTVAYQWYQQHCGLPIRDLLTDLPTSTAFPIDEVLAASRAHLLTATTPDTLAAIPATIDLTHRARAAGLPCAIASGTAAALVNAGLAALGLRDLFQTVVTREDVPHGKPAPDTFHEAARRLDTDPEDCLVVEDAPDGVTAARRAGTHVLLVRNGQLTSPPANFTTNDPQATLT